MNTFFCGVKTVAFFNHSWPCSRSRGHRTSPAWRDDYRGHRELRDKLQIWLHLVRMNFGSCHRLVAFCCKHVMYLYTYIYICMYVCFLFIHTFTCAQYFGFLSYTDIPRSPKSCLVDVFFVFVLGHFRAGVAQISSLRQPKPEIKPRYCWTVSCPQQEDLGFFIGDSYLIIYDLHPYLHYKNQVSRVPVVRYSAWVKVYLAWNHSITLSKVHCKVEKNWFISPSIVIIFVWRYLFLCFF